MNTLVVGSLVGIAVLAGFVLYRNRSGGSTSGYRGALGFKNRGSEEIAFARVTGLSAIVEVKTLAPGEHSFNYLGRVALAPMVDITWRSISDSADRTAKVSLETVPADLKDGEIFFVFSGSQGWTVESSPQLRIDQFSRGA
jgi:hypothetical protein